MGRPGCRGRRHSPPAGDCIGVPGRASSDNGTPRGFGLRPRWCSRSIDATGRALGGRQCPRMNCWLERSEGLAPPPAGWIPGILAIRRGPPGETSASFTDPIIGQIGSSAEVSRQTWLHRDRIAMADGSTRCVLAPWADSHVARAALAAAYSAWRHVGRLWQSCHYRGWDGGKGRKNLHTFQGQDVGQGFRPGPRARAPFRWSARSRPPGSRSGYTPRRPRRASPRRA